MRNKDHWEAVYARTPVDAVSWFQLHADPSVGLVQDTGLPKSAALIDIGGAASMLVDDLLAQGYTDLSVLDLSGAALAAAQQRLGTEAQRVRWLVGDITEIELPAQAYDLWHDRAVFHFLTTPEQRRADVRAVLRAVKPGGHVIVATFAEDGPTQCSGLPVVRDSPDGLHAEFGVPFTLLRHEEEEHRTPGGGIQKFIDCDCRKDAP